MSIGAGIALFVLGAILAFAVNGEILGGVIQLSMLGYILMGAGFIVFTLGMIMTFKKRETITTSRAAVDPVSGEAVQQSSTLHKGEPLI